MKKGIFAVAAATCAASLALSSTVMASDDDGGLLGALLEKGKEFVEAFPEKSEVEGVLDELGSKASSLGVDLSGLVDELDLSSIANSALEAVGELDLESVEGLAKGGASSLIAELLGGDGGNDERGEEESEDFDVDTFMAFYERLEAMNEAEKGFYEMDSVGNPNRGDVRIVSVGGIKFDGELDGELFKRLVRISRFEYDVDDSVLRLVDERDDYVLFEHAFDEDGNCEVVDARFVEVGEDFDAFCLELGISPDEGRENAEFARYAEVADIAEYLENHPEFDGVEYDGEVRTAAELDEIVDAAIGVYSNAEFGEEETEGGLF